MVRSVENRSDARPRSGLRERKKLAVRRALGSAAIRLAVERGLDNVTIEDITAEAGVSLRTFGNYFSSKYEAMCATGTDRARRIGAELLARPAREPLWEAIRAAVVAHYEGAARGAGRAVAGRAQARAQLAGHTRRVPEGHLRDAADPGRGDRGANRD